MAQEELRSGLRLRSRPHSMASSKNKPDEDWSHYQVVIHRLACGRRTLNQLRTIIETTLGEYFDKESNKDWKKIVEKVAHIFPHGAYELKPEILLELQPQVYPYEDDEDRATVASKVEEYHASLALEQGLPRDPSLKRSAVSDSEDEGEVGSGSDGKSASPPPSETPCTLSVNAARTPQNIQQEIALYRQEIEDLEKTNHDLKKTIEVVEELKTAALELQQRDKVTDEEIKQLRASNFEKDKQIKELQSVNSKNRIIIARLREQCDKANATNQAQITANSNDLEQKIKRLETDLRDAMEREQRYLAEDERRLQERRAATQQWW